MKSLYDLLGARENDDADALKKAFRAAVKANHPDLHPGDLDAAKRFKEIIAAHALLCDAQKRANYNRMLQLERQRSKRIRATAAVATVGAIIGGYGLFSAMSKTTTIAAIDKDNPSAATVAASKKDGQGTTAIAAADRNEDAQTATAAPKAYVVKGSAEGNVDNAGKPAETGVKVMAPTDALDQSEPRDKHDGTEVPNGASKPSADKQEGAEVPNGANKLSADKHEDAKVLNEANKPSDDAAAITRIEMQRLRDGGDAQATAGRELALGPPAADKHNDAQVPNGANKPSADKHEDAKVLNEANKPSDSHQSAPLGSGRKRGEQLR